MPKTFAIKQYRVDASLKKFIPKITLKYTIGI